MGGELLDAHACPLNVSWLGGPNLCVKRPSPCSELKVCSKEQSQPAAMLFLTVKIPCYYLLLEACESK